MMGLLDRAGARLTAHLEEAEILVVNTCSFIDTAKQESVDTILEMARHKTSGSARKLIVAGCLVERYRDEIMKSIPEVDAVVGTGELESILEAAGLSMAAVAASVSPFNILSSNGHAEVRPGLESRAATHKQGAKNPAPVMDAVANMKGTEASMKGTGFSPYIEPGTGAGALAPEGNLPETTNFRPEGNLRESQGRFSRNDWQGATHLLPTYLYDESTPRFLTTPRSSAYIKIAEG
ncbi:MAG: 30S ribosomal protein S12 methylthiotransferase RimO, partial [Acidimicrobiales bacterium]